MNKPDLAVCSCIQLFVAAGHLRFITIGQDVSKLL